MLHGRLGLNTLRPDKKIPKLFTCTSVKELCKLPRTSSTAKCHSLRNLVSDTAVVLLHVVKCNCKTNGHCAKCSCRKRKGCNVFAVYTNLLMSNALMDISLHADTQHRADDLSRFQFIREIIDTSELTIFEAIFRWDTWRRLSTAIHNPMWVME